MRLKYLLWRSDFILVSGESQRYYTCLFVDRSVVWIPKLPSLDWNLVLSDPKLPATELFDWEFIILILAVECSYVHDWWSINFVIKVVILESWWLSGTVWILSIWRRYLLSQFKLLFDWFWIGTVKGKITVLLPRVIKKSGLFSERLLWNLNYPTPFTNF